MIPPKKVINLLVGCLVIITRIRANRNMFSQNNKIFQKFYRTIVNEYFQNDRCIVVVADSKELLELAVSNTSVPYFLIYHEPICNNSLLVDDLIDAIDQRCSSYVVSVANPVCLVEAWGQAQLGYDTMTLQRVNPKIFMVSRDEAFLDVLMDMPLVNELISSLVVALIDTTKKGWQVEMYTNNFYERTNKPGRDPKILLNRWQYEYGFEEKKDLYLDKTLDLNGKELRVYAVDLLPYSSCSPFAGQEAELLSLFCILHNCTIVAITDDDLFGNISENVTGGDGLLGKVYKGEAEFGIAGFYYLVEYYRNIDYSAGYLQSGVVLLVAAPSRVGGLLVPFLPFNLVMWVAYIASVGVAAVLMFLITKATATFTRYTAEVGNQGMFLTGMDALFRSLGMSLQQPSPFIPHSPIRHLLTAFEILFKILATIYGAGLASCLASPQYTKPINTLHDLAASGIIWAGEHVAYASPLKFTDDPMIKTIVKNFRVEPIKTLREMAMSGKYGLILEILAGGHYTSRDYLNETIVAQSHVMTEYLYHSPLVTVIRKASPYTKHYNRLIGKLLSNGLLLYWEADASRKYLSSRMATAVEASRKLSGDGTARPLSLFDSIGVFALYLGGITLSCITLTGEILVASFKKSRSSRVSAHKEDS